MGRLDEPAKLDHAERSPATQRRCPDCRIGAIELLQRLLEFSVVVRFNSLLPELSGSGPLSSVVLGDSHGRHQPQARGDTCHPR